MVFTSKEFLVFFLACVAAYFLLRPRFRWILLLAASCLFYAAGEAQHLGLLILVSLLAYGAGLLLEAMREGPWRATLLAGAIAALLTPLFVFKYLGFVLQSVGSVAANPEQPASLGFDLLLPLGISFFTFQAVAYLVDVYRGDQRAERHPGYLSLYITFFPQLIAGPIERAGNLLPQFRRAARLDAGALVSGGRLMLWGAFKKLVIADNLAPYVDRVYGDPTAWVGLPLLIATLFFAFQIYCDFSGYIDIARGAARILGIDLMRNFDRPYGARSLVDFWRRWHISLSTWFRDYLYIPLGGNRRGRALTARNIAIVFLVSGLWHGANWTFVVWGGLHGLALLLLLASAPLRARLAATVGLDRHPLLYDALRVAVTFAFVCFAWIFFRAASLDDALHVIGHLFTAVPEQLADGSVVSRLIGASGGTPIGFTALLLAIAAIFAAHALPPPRPRNWLDLLPRWQRWGGYYALIFGLLFWSGSSDAFIYFRF